MDEEEDDLSQPSSLEARLQKVAGQRREARRERDAARTELEALRAQLAEKQQQIDAAAELTQQLERYQQMERGWATEKAIMGAGITDPEGVEFVRMAYGRLGDDRPALSDWLAQADSLPRAVQVYLPQPAAPAAAPPAQAPNPDRGAQPFTRPPAGNFSQAFRSGQFTADDVASAWAELGIQPPKLD